jgi:hypothetical protein
MSVRSAVASPVARRALRGRPVRRTDAPFGFRGRPAEAPGPRKTRAPRAAAVHPRSPDGAWSGSTLCGPASAALARSLSQSARSCTRSRVPR